MMPLSHLFNILECIEKNADLKAARAWFLKARRELQSDQFADLIQSVFRWLLNYIPNQSLVEESLRLLAEFDPVGDAVRKAEIERTKQQRLEAERSLAKRQRQERIRVEQEFHAREERERVAAQRMAEAERERERQEKLREIAEERKRAILVKIDDLLRSDFLATDAYFRTLPSGIVSEQEFETRKLDFVRQWIAQHSGGREGTTRNAPDSQQLAAIAEVHGHVQVIARAGSGKTATLVNRAFFLLQHCRVDPGALLLLAFNRKAAVEVRRRLLELIHDGAERAIRAEVDQKVQSARGKRGRVNRDEIEATAVDSIAERLNVDLPHVMTFHALAYSIVHPEESLLYNGVEGEAQGLSKAFQGVIDDHLLIPEYKNKIRDLMVSHFREDWDRIVAGRYDQTKEELLRFRRSLPRESLGGDYVKSFGEKLIADFLFEHDIPYKYERNHWWGDVNYRPDFTIFKTAKNGLVIEYFGLAGDPDYDEMSEEKRVYWRSKQDWVLLEFTSSDITHRGKEAFRDLLKRTLEDQGVACERLSEDEIWYRIRDRAIDRFTAAAVNFVGRCRKKSLSPDGLRDLVDSYEPLSPVEGLFLDLAHILYVAYLNRLSATGEEDFDGLMQRAAALVDSGLTKFQRKSGGGDLARLRFVCIDEFQDFSDLFHRVLSSIRKVNSDVELFCVGDDWQAINGFAGSDLRFFDRFDEHIGKSRRLYISTNYRSSRSIVAAGNALMDGLGKRAVSHKESEGTVLLIDSIAFRPSLIEKKRHPGDIITPIVSRIVNRALESGSDLVMLSRRNSLPWFVNFGEQGRGEGRGLANYLELIRSLFPKGLNERISISTAHRYKGLEKPTVIVLDAVARSYPLIHPDWAFSRVFGDSPKKIAQEERRLLYVAMTRATEKLVVITDGQSQSPFLDELEVIFPLQKIDWSEYPPVRGLSSRLIVKVGNQEGRGGAPTFAIKDQLKATGYQWQSAGWPGWAKSFPADGFQIEKLKSEIWARAGDGIDVRIYDETEALIGKALIDSGEWATILDGLAAVCSDGRDN